MLKITKPEEQEWFLEELAKLSEDDDYCSPCEAVVEPDNGVSGIWVHTEESGDPGALAEVIAEWQRKFKSKEEVIISYALTCSKPRLGEFGGGAILIYRGKIYGFDGQADAMTKLRQLKRTRAVGGRRSKRERT
jgi:hypothetical protein